MSAKHTPGPCVHGYPPNSPAGLMHSGCARAPIKPCGGIGRCGPCSSNEDGCPLHRAAPELLEALKALVSDAEEISSDRMASTVGLQRSIDRARAAIAKAEGGGK